MKTFLLGLEDILNIFNKNLNNHIIEWRYNYIFFKIVKINRSDLKAIKSVLLTYYVWSGLKILRINDKQSNQTKFFCFLLKSKVQPQKQEIYKDQFIIENKLILLKSLTCPSCFLDKKFWVIQAFD